jgi:hypothetical protein
MEIVIAIVGKHLTRFLLELLYGFFCITIQLNIETIVRMLFFRVI